MNHEIAATFSLFSTPEGWMLVATMAMIFIAGGALILWGAFQEERTKPEEEES